MWRKRRKQRKAKEKKKETQNQDKLKVFEKKDGAPVEADPTQQQFGSNYDTSAKKKFEDLDPKIQQLIIDTGTTITNEEDLAALSEISVQEKIMLFERIARGMSKKAALMEITRELVKKRREREIQRKIREEEYKKKKESYDLAAKYLKEKMEMAEKDEEKLKNELRITREKLRSAGGLERANLQKEKMALDEKLDVLAEILKTGKDAQGKLDILKEDAEMILKEDKERALKRLRRREGKDKAAFEESYEKFKNLVRKYDCLVRGIDEEEERRRLAEEEERRRREEEERRRREEERRRREEEERLRRLAEIRKIAEEEERKRREEEERRRAEEERRRREEEERKRREEEERRALELARKRREEELRRLREQKRREMEYNQAIKQFDSWDEYLAEMRLNIQRDKKELLEEQKKLQAKMEEEGEDMDEFEEGYCGYNLDLIQRELETIEEMEGAADQFGDQIVFLRKNRFKMLMEEDREKEEELKEKEKDGIIQVQDKKILLDSLLKKLDMMEDERCNRDFVKNYMTKSFEDFSEIAQDKVQNCAREIQKKSSEIEDIEEKLEDESLIPSERQVLELKRDIHSEELEFNMKLMQEAQEFMKGVEEHKDASFGIWGDIEMEQAEESENYQTIVVEKGDNCKKAFMEGFNFTPEQIEQLCRIIKDEFEEASKNDLAKVLVGMVEMDKDQDQIMDVLIGLMGEEDAIEVAEFLEGVIKPEIERDMEFDIESEKGKRLIGRVKQFLLEKQGPIGEHLFPRLLVETVNGKPWDETKIQNLFNEVGFDEQQSLHNARWLFDEITKLLLNDREVKEARDKFEKVFEDGFDKLRDRIQKTENALLAYLEKSKTIYNAFKEGMVDRLKDLNLKDEEKKKRETEMPKQLDLHSQVHNWCDTIQDKIDRDQKEKENMMEKIELQLDSDELDGQQREVFDDKKKKTEQVITLLDDLSQKAQDFDEVFRQLKSCALAMMISDDTDVFMKLRNEKQLLVEDFEQKFKALLELLKKYEAIDEMEQAKKFAFYKRLEEIEAWLKQIKDHKSEMDIEKVDVAWLVNNSAEETTKNYHTEDELKNINDRVDQYNDQGREIEDISERIVEAKALADNVGMSNLSVLCCDEDDLFEDFKRNDYGKNMEMTEAMDELNRLMKEYEDKTMGRMTKRKQRYAQRRRRKRQADNLRKKELEAKLAFLQGLVEQLENCTDEGERRGLFERIRAMLNQIRLLGDESVVQEYISELGWDISDLSEEQKKLKLQFDGLLEGLDMMLLQKEESEIDRKLRKFRDQLLHKRSELQEKIKDKRDQIIDLEQKINSGDFAGKEVALMKFKKKCLEKQETALRRLIDQFDELIQAVNDIFKDDTLDERAKARKLKALIQKLKQYQQIMKDACRRAEEILNEKREEFAFKKEEEFEDEDTLIFYIVDMKTTEFLNKQFNVAKRDPKKKMDKFLSAMLHRLYEVDFLGHRVKDMKTTNGKVITEVKPENILTVERYYNNTKGLRVLTMEAGKSYELICKSNEEREILYSLISAIRPYVYSYCPSLCSKSSVRCLTTVTGFYSKPSTYKEDVPMSKRSPKFEGTFKLRVTRKPYEELMVWVGTWNVVGVKPPKNIIGKLMNLEREFDIYCLCIQEGSFRNAKLLKDYFKDVIKPKAREQHKFILANAEALKEQCQIMIICNTTTGLKISNAKASSINYKKLKGNSVCVSMSVNETNFLFICSQFQDNKGKPLDEEKKIAAYKQTLLGLEGGYRYIDIWSQYDYIFWGGDFGFQISDKDTYNFLVEEKNEIDDIIDEEPLNKMKEEGKMFQDFEEPEINFFPNYPYKFQKGEAELVRNKKFGNPSWRHRVFYKKINPNYNCAELYYKTDNKVTVGPHLLTSALFKLQTRVPFNTINEKNDKKYEIEFISLQYKCEKEELHNPIKKPSAAFYCNFVESWGYSAISPDRNVHSPTWKEADLPSMVSSLPKHCLNDLYVIIAVRDGKQETGIKQKFGNLVVTGVVFLEEAIKALEYYGTHKFEIPCYHQGSRAGKLEGELFVKYHVAGGNKRQTINLN